MRHAIVAMSLLSSGCLSLTAFAADDFVPVTDAMLRQPAAADWLMWRRTYDGWGYSPLTTIDRSNVARLELVWSRSLEEGMQEATPLVYHGVLYMPNPRDVIQALNPADGKLLWEYRRQMPADLKEFIGASETKRNIAIHGRSLVHTTNDDHIVALDAVTGAVLWDTQILDYHTQAAQQSAGPIVVEGKAISGRGCFPLSGPDACVVTAHDVATGREVWRWHNIQREGEGKNTWGDVPYAERWHVGAWMIPSYDPELRLIYMGTSVTAPAPKFLLGGDDQAHLYHNTTLALAPDDGHLVWHYQHNIDHWDLDHPFERILVDTAVAPDPTTVPWRNPHLQTGERRRVVTGVPGKTGIVYTLDRATGEFLWARPTVTQNVVSAIDGVTGKVIVNPGMRFSAMGDERLICPSSSGGKMWFAGAYSPLTNVMYQPVQNTCMTATVTIDKRDPEALYGVATKVRMAPGTENLGSLFAIDVASGANAWRHDQRAAVLSLLTTGGGLLFGGDAGGKFRAYDQKTGAILWEIDLGSPVTGYPISFEANGRQYVAVSTGYSITTASYQRVAPDVAPPNVNKLFVFALPAK